jgi:hypothetical protein
MKSWAAFPGRVTAVRRQRLTHRYRPIVAPSWGSAVALNVGGRQVSPVNVQGSPVLEYGRSTHRQFGIISGRLRSRCTVPKRPCARSLGDSLAQSCARRCTCQRRRASWCDQATCLRKLGQTSSRIRNSPCSFPDALRNINHLDSALPHFISRPFQPNAAFQTSSPYSPRVAPVNQCSA